MADAYQTGDTIIEDWTNGEPMLNDGKEVPIEQSNTKPVLDLLRSKGHRTVSYADWKKIEQKEFDLGARVGKPREKILSVEEMLKVLD
jgi:adrenodoxin-NADP+ reductase